MKCILFFMAMWMIPVFVNCQLLISDESANYYAQPGIKVSYTVSLTLKVIEKNDTSIIDKGLIKRVEYDKGLFRKVITYYDGKKSSRTCQYFYKDRNVIKCLVKYTHERTPEVYYFNYDSKNNLIREIGYQGKKIIYRRIVSKKSDTIVTNTFYDHFQIVATEQERKVFSEDSLEEFSILKLDHQTYPRFSRKKYNANKQIILEVDSSKEAYSQKIFQYDSIGRIKRIEWKGLVLEQFKDFRYDIGETQISTFGIYQSPGTQYLQELQILRYDKSGNLYYEKITKFENGEDSFSLGRVVEKYYEDNRLQQVFVKGGNDLYLYNFKYD